MSNYCQTQITINHNDESKLKDLESKISEAIKEDKNNENDFGYNWLGNIVINMNLGTINRDPETDLFCRGVISYLEYADNQLIIETETTWNPAIKMWVILLEKYLPDAELIYRSEECGTGLYVTNDPYYFDKYNINSSNHNLIESKDDADKFYIITVLQDLLKIGESNIENLLKLFNESEYKNNIRINKWKFIEPNKFN